MKLFRKKELLSTSLFLSSMLLVGCVSTNELNNVQKDKLILNEITTNGTNVKESKVEQTASDKNRSIEKLESNIKNLGAMLNALSNNNNILEGENNQLKRLNVQNSDSIGLLQTQIKALEDLLAKRSKENMEGNSSLNQKNLLLKRNIDKLKQAIKNSEQLSEINKKNITELTIALDEVNATLGKSNTIFTSQLESFSNKNESDKNSIWISLVILAILFIAVLVITLVFRAKAKKELFDSKKQFEAEYNSLDLKLAELLESQTEAMSVVKNSSSQNGNEPDHTIPLKVLTELHRMKNRLIKMPQDTKGLKPLTKAVARIEENLMEKGYEIVELLNKPYIDGMTVNQEYIFDESLSADERVISKVVKPQINFDGVIAQVADVIVSIGE